MKVSLKKLTTIRMQALLSDHGFSTFHGGLLYGRIVDAIAQGVIFSGTRYKGESIVVCAMCAVEPGISAENFFKSEENRNSLSASDAKWVLSKNFQFRSGEDWDFSDNAAATESLSSISRLLEQYAIPVFDKVSSPKALELASDSNYGHSIANTMCAAISKEVEGLGFSISCDGDFIWRKNGDVVAIILPTVVGFGCFVTIYVLLWSPLLEQAATGSSELLFESGTEPPEDFSQVSFAFLKSGGIAPDELGELLYIGTNADQVKTKKTITESLMHKSFIEWLDVHGDTESMLSLIQDGMQKTVRRRIEGLSEG